MRRMIVPLLLATTLCGAPVAAWAQTAPPPETEATPQQKSSNEPAPVESNQTLGGNGETAEPAEGGEAGGEAAGPAAEGQWGIGVRLREVFMPLSVLQLFLKGGKGMAQQGVGIEVTYRKGERDIVFGGEFDNISPDDWNIRGNNDTPDLTKWTRFDSLGLLSVDASVIWNSEIVRGLDFRYGAGLGVGLVTGAIYKTPEVGCTESNFANPAQCHPAGVTPNSNGYSPAQIEALNMEIKVTGVPPVVPVVAATLGLRYRIADRAAINLEAGFRDVFFVGLGAGYYF
jgi:hypothetical protein